MTDAPSPIAHGHGNTKAAWTAVTIIIIASIVGTLGVMMGNWVVFWVGVALVAVGGIVGKVMQMMGLGQSLHA
ncbi:MAG: HGxxPAAW family protein [Actinomycetota bacterium]|nr:HGxxPAAW family protein [Actinomycetota bacterium]